MRLLRGVAIVLALTGCQVLSGLSELEIDEGASDQTDDANSDDTGTASVGDASTSTGGDAGCTPPDGLACTPGDNCGCDSEETCSLIESEDSTRSELLCINPGNQRSGEACEAAEDCGTGLLCLREICVQACRTASDCDAANAVCETYMSGDGEVVPEVRYCSSACSARDSDPDDCEQPCAVPDVPDSTCGVLPSCGCERGQTCRVVDASGRTACSPVGDVASQGVCSSNSDCQAEHACVSGLCRPYCAPEVKTCGDTSICFPLLDDGEPVQGVAACLGHCDPVNPDQDDDTFTPCGDGAYCAVGVDGTELESAYCMSAVDEQIAQGEYCEELAQCGNGSLCAGRCMPLCRSAEDCEGLTTEPACELDLGEDVVLQASPDDEVGVCCTPTPTPRSTCSTLEGGCGCPSGQACYLADVETGQTECFPEGDVGLQSVCVANEDCQSGLTCVDSLCRPLCVGQACSPDQGRCLESTYQTATGDIEPVPFSRACTGHCDPVELSRDDEQFAPCGSGARCLPGHEGVSGLEESYCQAGTDEAQAGELCDFDEDCVNGYGCIGYTCVAWCRSEQDCERGPCDMDYPRPVAPNDWVGFCAQGLLPIDPLSP